MTDQSSNQMWGGRFAAGPDAIMEAINASIGFDKRMAAQDIAGSRAHAAMLAATGVISVNDAEAIGKGLLTVLSEIEWTDTTWNPVAGCTAASSGCTNCYAMHMALRLEAMGMENQGITCGAVCVYPSR